MINRSTIIDRLKYLLKIPDATKVIDHLEIVARSRETLADTIEPYRWGDEQLTEFVNDGVSELKNMRADVERMVSVPHSFTSALSNYTVYRAFAIDNDAQNNNGAISDKYMNLFREQSSAINYFFTDEQLTGFINETIDVLISRRPELRISDTGTLKSNIESDGNYDLPAKFGDCIAHGAAGRAAYHAKNDQAQYFFEQFNGALQTI